MEDRLAMVMEEEHRTLRWRWWLSMMAGSEMMRIARKSVTNFRLYDDASSATKWSFIIMMMRASSDASSATQRSFIIIIMRASSDASSATQGGLLRLVLLL
ncbi:unnamed protein product [Sphagnum balticum]